MQITVESDDISQQAVDTIVAQATEDSRRLIGPAGQIDDALDGLLSTMRRDGLITGRVGEVRTVPTAGRIPASRVIVHGLGKREKLTVDLLRNQTAAISRTLRDQNAGNVALSSYAGTYLTDTSPEEAGRTLGEAIELGLYRFDKHHTKAADRPRGSIEAITIVEPTRSKVAGLRRGVEQGQILARRRVHRRGGRRPPVRPPRGRRRHPLHAAVSRDRDHTPKTARYPVLRAVFGVQ